MWSIILYLVLLPLTSNGQCHLPTVAEIESGLNELLRIADDDNVEGPFNATVSSYNYTCLAQGSTKDTYRIVSIIATFTPNNRQPSRTQHFQLVCSSGTWSAVTDDRLDTPPSNPMLRTDCFSCVPDNFGGDSNHCLGELLLLL